MKRPFGRGPYLGDLLTMVTNWDSLGWSSKVVDPLTKFHPSEISGVPNQPEVGNLQAQPLIDQKILGTAVPRKQIPWRIHVWYIFIHTFRCFFHGKCRGTWHTWILWKVERGKSWCRIKTSEMLFWQNGSFNCTLKNINQGCSFSAPPKFQIGPEKGPFQENYNTPL